MGVVDGLRLGPKTKVLLVEQQRVVALELVRGRVFKLIRTLRQLLLHESVSKLKAVRNTFDCYHASGFLKLAEWRAWPFA